MANVNKVVAAESCKTVIEMSWARHDTHGHIISHQKEGSYVKVWAGREDNEHLSDLLATMDVADDDFAESLYKGLVALYPG